MRHIPDWHCISNRNFLETKAKYSIKFAYDKAKAPLSCSLNENLKRRILILEYTHYGNTGEKNQLCNMYVWWGKREGGGKTNLIFDNNITN